MTEPQYTSRAALEAGLAHILASPKDAGRLELIVARPQIDQRLVLQSGHLDTREGLSGDNWKDRYSSLTPDHRPHPDDQVTLMNSRVIDLLANDRERWQIAGDQLYVDLDLSTENLPPGTRLQVGEAVVVVTDLPHTGCSKFAARFGPEALKFVNGAEHKRLRLRGINARVLRSGAIRPGDAIHKLPQA